MSAIDFTAAGFTPRGQKPAVRLFLDDQFDDVGASDRIKWAASFTHKVKTAQDAIALLSTGTVDHVSLDHDLGDPAVVGTGYDVATWIEEAAYNGTIPRLTWNVHSMNPVGKDLMVRALRSADKYWDRHEA